MAKRFLKPHAVSSKKARLDISVSDHNFPLSQNTNQVNSEAVVDDWGDDNEDEILLLASQACENAEVNNTTVFSESRLNVLPYASSTQNTDMFPHTSSQVRDKNFKFKTSINDRTKISMSNDQNDLTKRLGQFPVNNIDIRNTCSPVNGKPQFSSSNTDIILNNKDTGRKDEYYFYKQYMALQKENDKLLTDNGKLQDQCLTKDGEVSILRTQLKAAHMETDSVRLDKLKMSEKNQIEWIDKLSAANNEIQNLKTQIEFKNLEVVNTKERYRMLESNKVKLMQVSLHQVDKYSQRTSNVSKSCTQLREMFNSATVSVQTQEFQPTLQLKAAYREHYSIIKDWSSSILEPTCEEHSFHSIFNENLQDGTNPSQINQRKNMTNHKVTNMPKSKLKLSSIHGDVRYLIKLSNSQFYQAEAIAKCLRIGATSKLFLLETLQNFETLAMKTNATYVREMDEKYLEEAKSHNVLTGTDLFSGKCIHEQEQAVDTRRIVMATTALGGVCPPLLQCLVHTKPPTSGTSSTDKNVANTHIDVMYKICKRIELITCASLFTGLLLSFVHTIIKCTRKLPATILASTREKLFELLKCIILTRPRSIVLVEAIVALKDLATEEAILRLMCQGNASGNLNLDFDQGIILFHKGSCLLQVMLNQLGLSMLSVAKAKDIDALVKICQSLIKLYRNASELNIMWASPDANYRCYCSLRIPQTIILSLNVCATAYIENKNSLGDENAKSLRALLRTGLLIINLWLLNEVELSTILEDYEGHYQLFLKHCDKITNDIISDSILGKVLSEIMNNLQPSYEDTDLPSTELNDIWEDNFNRFCISE